MKVDIPNTFYWTTEHVLTDNPTIMCEFLYYYLPEEYNVTSIYGVYTEIISPDGVEYSAYASSNGDLYNHKIEFERV